MGEIKHIGGFKVLPPAPDSCQVCAQKHEPTEPHNPQSLYYQFTFNAEHGRSATWKDAMAHCTTEVVAKWMKGFRALIRDGKLCIEACDLSDADSVQKLIDVMSSVSGGDAVAVRIQSSHKYFAYINKSVWDGCDKKFPGMNSIKINDLCL